MSRVLSFILIWGSLAIGTLAATTAYLPKLADVTPADGTAAEDLLVLAADAGAAVDADADDAEVVDPDAESESEADAPTEPFVEADDALTPETAAALAEQGVERVRVKSFDLKNFMRWGEWLIFALACVGLVAGGLIVRRNAKADVEAQTEAAAQGQGGHVAPADALAMARNELARLILAGPGPQRLDSIRSTLDTISARSFEPFVDARPLLIGNYGVGGFARVMDAFAGAERTLNRAWSAAADGQHDESEECLRVGLARLDDTIGVLAAETARR